MAIPVDVEIIDADNARRSINAPLDPGRALAAESRPVALSTEDKGVLDAMNAVLGTTAGAAVTTSVAGTIQQYLRGVVSLLVSGITVATHAVTQSGSWVLSAGSALIGKVGIDQTTPGTTNAVAIASPAGTRVEKTVAVGGTAANLFVVVPVNGYEVINCHATEWLYIREADLATVADNSTSTPIAPRGSYTTPVGYKPTGNVNYVAATSGHAVIARWW